MMRVSLPSPPSKMSSLTVVPTAMKVSSHHLALVVAAWTADDPVVVGAALEKVIALFSVEEAASFPDELTEPEPPLSASSCVTCDAHAGASVDEIVAARRRAGRSRHHRRGGRWPPSRRWLRVIARRAGMPPPERLLLI